VIIARETAPGNIRKGSAVLGAMMLVAPAAAALLAATPAAQAASRTAGSPAAADPAPIAGLVVVCTPGDCFPAASTFECAPGHSYGSSGVTVSGMEVLNGCSYRIWLDQDADGSGYSLCIKADSSTGALHRNYKRLYMSGSQPAC
jgi:hypothetical protein